MSRWVPPVSFFLLLSIFPAMAQTPAAQNQDESFRVYAEHPRLLLSTHRLQLLRKNPRAFEEFLSHLREHSPEGKAHTLSGYQASRPSLQDFAKEFSSLQIPVLLIVGDEDEPCLETTLWLKQILPGAGLWIFPNSGHAVNLEEPAAFNRAVEDFLRAVDRGRWRC